jgi:hypothetical protein
MRKEGFGSAPRGTCSSPGGGAAVGSAGQTTADPVASLYRLRWSPAVAEIVGDGRPWTVLMISELSMPCR